MLILIGCTSKAAHDSVPVSEVGTFQPAATWIPRSTLRPTQTIPIPTLHALETNAALKDVCQQFAADSSGDFEISPNGEWSVINCGYKRNQTLIVQSQLAAKWVLHFTDFLNRPDVEGMPGRLLPLAWSPDGRYLYFSKALGYSGGGNQCFSSEHGLWGLYRLDVQTGTTATLIPSDDDRFPGDEIEFSPTSEYYAADIHGVTITNVVTGKVNVIDAPPVMAMSWSPDGRYLAFSVARCGDTFVESSSMLVWDSTTEQAQVLFSTEEMVLRPVSWTEGTKLAFEGEAWVGRATVFTVFEYDLAEDEMMFSGTVTPDP